MTESFFFTGKRMKEGLRLSPFDEIVFSDYSRNCFVYYESGIRFTKEMLFLCQDYSNIGIESDRDDWQDWEIVEICPWENIVSIDTYDGRDVIRSVSKDEIESWLAGFQDTVLSFPILRITNNNIAIVMEGRPYSVRSQKSLLRQKGILQNIIPKITRIVKKPLDVPTSLYVDVFTTEKRGFPDTDRFVPPVMDFFKGILYQDDAQIESLHPRVLSMEKPFTVLECRSEPMGLSSVRNIPVGSLLPLVKNMRDYYVIRFRI